MKIKYLFIALAAVALVGAYACKKEDDMTQSRLFRPASVAFTPDSIAITYTLSWVGVKGAAAYTYDVCDSTGYSPAHVVIEGNTTATILTFDVSVPSGFVKNHKYWFRVKANTAPGSATAGSKYAELGFTTPKWNIAQ